MLLDSCVMIFTLVFLLYPFIHHQLMAANMLPGDASAFPCAEAQWVAAGTCRITDILACFSPCHASFYWLARTIREPQDSGS